MNLWRSAIVLLSVSFLFGCDPAEDGNDVTLAVLPAPDTEDNDRDTEEDIDTDTVKYVFGGSSSTGLCAEYPETLGELDAGIVLPNYSFRDLDNKEVTLCELVKSSSRLMLINLAGYWCPSCRVDIPDLIAAAGKYRNSGVVVAQYLADGGTASAMLSFADGERYDLFRTIPDGAIVGDLGKQFIGYSQSIVVDLKTMKLLTTDCYPMRFDECIRHYLQITK